MPTNLPIDDRLITEARAVGGHKTMKEAVTAALEEYIKRRKQRGILDLVGQVAYDPAYDYKTARRLRRGALRRVRRGRCGRMAGARAILSACLADRDAGHASGGAGGKAIGEAPHAPDLFTEVGV